MFERLTLELIDSMLDIKYEYLLINDSSCTCINDGKDNTLNKNNVLLHNKTCQSKVFDFGNIKLFLNESKYLRKHTGYDVTFT
jgi:hypothetical protein